MVTWTKEVTVVEKEMNLNNIRKIKQKNGCGVISERMS